MIVWLSSSLPVGAYSPGMVNLGASYNSFWLWAASVGGGGQ